MGFFDIFKKNKKTKETKKTTGAKTEKDNLGTRHDTVDIANGYWMGERLASSHKPPFTMYIFENGKDAEDALLELPFIHKASDTGNLICDRVLVFGYYKVSDRNYEAIVCGDDLSYDEFKKAEESFEKHGGRKKNNLEPDKSAKSSGSSSSTKATGEVKFREKFTQNQYTYECYDAKTKEDALNFLQGKEVNQRLYYVCVYTPEGDFGRDIQGIYQM